MHQKKGKTGKKMLVSAVSKRSARKKRVGSPRRGGKGEITWFPSLLAHDDRRRGKGNLEGYFWVSVSAGEHLSEKKKKKKNGGGGGGGGEKEPMLDEK